MALSEAPWLKLDAASDLTIEFLRPVFSGDYQVHKEAANQLSLRRNGITVLHILARQQTNSAIFKGVQIPYDRPGRIDFDQPYWRMWGQFSLLAGQADGSKPSLLVRAEISSSPQADLTTNLLLDQSQIQEFAGGRIQAASRVFTNNVHCSCFSVISSGVERVARQTYDHGTHLIFGIGSPLAQAFAYDLAKDGFKFFGPSRSEVDLECAAAVDRYIRTGPDTLQSICLVAAPLIDPSASQSELLEKFDKAILQPLKASLVKIQPGGLVVLVSTLAIEEQLSGVSANYVNVMKVIEKNFLEIESFLPMVRFQIVRMPKFKSRRTQFLPGFTTLPSAEQVMGPLVDLYRQHFNKTPTAAKKLTSF